MKIAVLTFYICFTLLYLFMGDSSRNWGGFNMITQFMTIASLSWFCLERDRLIVFERLLFYYVIFINIALSLYTIPCIWANNEWVQKYTYLFTSFVGMVFIITIIYGWLKYRNELGER